MTADPRVDDNPYAPPTSRGLRFLTPGPKPSLELFLMWEKLRLLYNATLAVEVVLLILSGLARLDSLWRLDVIALAFAANVCFSTAPVVEGYAILLGIRSRVVTGLLFLGGTTLSILLTAEALRDLTWWKMF